MNKTKARKSIRKVCLLISSAHFKRMQERPSVKKLLAYEKEVNEGFAKTA
jgi:hypothetical protein